jgi:hypothetical protein
MNRILFPVFLLAVLSTEVCLAEEDSRLGFPKSLRKSLFSWEAALEKRPAADSGHGH